MINERIQLNDSMLDVVSKMSEGNPGALTVCMELLRETENIDKDSALGGLGTILSLDSFNIYVSRIWMLYKDVCKQDIVKTIAVLRACQLGILTRTSLNYAIDNYGRGIDVESLYKQVKAKLPNFK